MKPIPFAATLRPSMQDEVASPQPVPLRRARFVTPERKAGGLWEPAIDVSTPRSLLAITPPRPSNCASPGKAGAGNRRGQRENLPPYNSSPPRAAARERSRPTSTPPRASSSRLLEESLDTSSSPPAFACNTSSRGDSCVSTPVRRGLRSRSRSPLKRHALGEGPPREASTKVLVSHIDQLRSALKTAYSKLDTLEQERASLKEQLAEVERDSGAHAARMRVLETQLKAVRRQDENRASSALVSVQQKCESQRKSLSHKERELAVLSSVLEERDGQFVQMKLERDAAREEIETLRDELADLHHGMHSLQESLRLMEERNADLAGQHAALADELEQSKSRNSSLTQQLMAYSDDMEANTQHMIEENFAAVEDRRKELTAAGQQDDFQDLQRFLAWLPFLDSQILCESQRSRETIPLAPSGSVRHGNTRASVAPATAGLDQSGISIPHDGTKELTPFAEAPSTPQRAESMDGYVRKEVLEQVKRKAKSDLAELEGELMSVILRMETEHKEYAAARADLNRATSGKPAAASETSPASLRSPVRLSASFLLLASRLFRC